MKPIVLIFLFIFTVQNEIHFNPPKNNEPHKRRSFYQISPSQSCDPGYYKDCFFIEKYRGPLNLPKRCYCYEKQSQKVKRILNEVTTTKDKDKDKPKGDPSPKYYPFRGKVEEAYRSIAKCHGDYYVCYNYPFMKIKACHCSKNPY